MRSKLVTLGLSLTTLAPLSALAADLPTSKPPVAPVLSPAPVTDWGGFYAGSFIGGGLGAYSTRQTTSASGSAIGLATGGLIGYNWQSNAYVYGLEGDITSNNATRRFNPVPGMVGNTVDSLYSLHARARLGYDMGMFLPFAAAGLAYGRNEQLQLAPFDNDGDTHTGVGWTLGAGVDTKVTLPILGPSVLRAEYLYESLPTETFDLNGPRMRTDIATHYVRFALISRMGGSWVAPARPENVDWSGSYAGLIGGGSWQTLSTQGGGSSTKFPASGAIGGLYTGHNWMFGNTMLGFESATMLANVTGHGAQPEATATSYHQFLESDYVGRAGYAMGRLLPFVAAGVAYGQSQQIDQVNGDERGHVPALAWTAGLGVDYMLTERIALRAQYSYSHSFTNEETHLDTDTCCSQTRTDQSLRLGAAYFFH